MSDVILLAPETRRGRGAGHFVRCLRLARRFPDRFRLYLPELAEDDAQALLERFEAGDLEDTLVGDSLEHDTGALEAIRGVVIDMPWVDASRLERLTLQGRLPAVGIDLGGAARAYALYLVDTLPRVRERHPANLRDAALLSIRFGRPTRADRPASECRILVSFGGEDPYGLSGRMATALLRAGVRPEEITVALGPQTESATLPKGVRAVRPGSALADYIAASELVCSSFGMTALEAAAAGAGVLLLNPTRYHRALSRKLGFPDVGVRRPRKRRLRRYLRSPEWLRRQAAGAIPRRQRDLGEFLGSLDLRETGACPVCRTTGNRALARFSDRSFFRCRECGMLYRVNLSPEKISYDADYFFAEYRNQYGKTYLEDFAHIKSMGERRLDLIDSLGDSPRERPEGDARTLLDVGCAYGPFLQAAQERGYRAYGIDVADSAVEYVGNTLGIPARVARLESFDPEQAFGRARFDVVSLWYVIEHIEELKHALEVLNRLLVPGGVLAFSTPNGRGISGRRNKTRFLEQSPADHVTVWDPPQAKRILARFGFVAERVRVTGHHPERFPGVPASALRGGAGLLARGLAAGAGAISRLFGLGDTFEIYARKAEAIA